MSRHGATDADRKSAALLVCGTCEAELSAESSSRDFCSQECQEVWHAERADPLADEAWFRPSHGVIAAAMLSAEARANLGLPPLPPAPPPCPTRNYPLSTPVSLEVELTRLTET